MKKKYFDFLKKAYAKSELIYADFDSVIKDISSLKNGKFEIFLNHIIDIVTKYDNEYPYTRLVLKKIMRFIIFYKILLVGKSSVSLMI